MNNYCVAQTSLAHTYGNVTCFFTQYVQSLFPENYIQTTHISSTIAYRQFNIFQNTKKEFIRKRKPMLIIRPRIELNDNDTFLYNTFLTTRMTDNYMDTCFTNLQPFIYDTERGNTLKFLLNRVKMFFDVTIITETQMQQLDWANYLKNRIRQEKPFMLEACLESYVPRELMRVMSEDVDIPVYDENGSVKNFLDYVNGISQYPVTYKMKDSTGNDEFFRFYPVNIDTMFTGLSIDDGSKRGMVADAFTISFTISAEFNAAGLYYYFSRKPDFIGKFITSLVEESSGKIIPLFTIDSLHVDKLSEGWNVYTAPMYKVQTINSPDVLDIKQLLNNSLIHCIEYHKSNGIPLETFIRVGVKCNNKDLRPTLDYDIDFNEYTLTTKRVIPDATYRLMIHVNTAYINDILDRMFELSKPK